MTNAGMTWCLSRLLVALGGHSLGGEHQAGGQRRCLGTARGSCGSSMEWSSSHGHEAKSSKLGEPRLVGKCEPTEMSQLLWMQPARSSPTLWFGQDKMDKKHLEVIWEIAMLQPWGLLLRRRWGWGLKKAHQHQTPSSLVSRGMLWKRQIDETQGRLIQNKACRHSSHCRVFLNDSCARVCVCRRSRDCWLCLHTFPCPELTSLGRWVPRNKLS